MVLSRLLSCENVYLFQSRTEILVYPKGQIVGNLLLQQCKWYGQYHGFLNFTVLILEGICA